MSICANDTDNDGNCHLCYRTGGCKDFPKSLVITLCGSARFEELFKKWNLALSLAGHTVFTLTTYPSDQGGDKNWYSPRQKTILDLVHKNKIRHSDAILVINEFGYLGDSTLSEIAYAKELGIDIFSTNSWGKGLGCTSDMLDHVLYRMKKYNVTPPVESPIGMVHGRDTICPLSSTKLFPLTPKNRTPILEVLRYEST